jgi:hypothetical protein
MALTGVPVSPVLSKKGCIGSTAIPSLCSTPRARQSLGKAKIVPPLNAAETAKNLLKHRPSRASDFNRPLRYPKLAY